MATTAAFQKKTTIMPKENNNDMEISTLQRPISTKSSNPSANAKPDKMRMA